MIKYYPLKEEIMKRALLSTLMCFSYLSSCLAMEAATHGLDPSQRPKDLKYDIQKSFDRFSSSSGKNWLYQGESSVYSIMKIDAANFAHTLIKTAPKEQKDFYLLDIGAGTFGWARGTAAYLNRQTDIPDDVTIHIVSVTGENYGPLKIEESGRCKIYNLSAFKIEDLKESFGKLREELGFDYIGNFDLIVSSFTFIHLHDPVGTFVQAYDLLRPKTGYMLMEGIPVFFVGQTDNEQLVYNLIDLLFMTKAPFLIGPGHGERWIESFLLKRPDDKLLELPLTYGSGTFPPRIVHTEQKMYANFTIGEGYTRPFDPSLLNVGRLGGAWGSPHYFYGDRDLYEWVYDHYDDWKKMDTIWLPMIKDDQRNPIEHLHEVRYIAPPKEIIPPDPIFKIAEDGTLEEFKAAITNDKVNRTDKSGVPLIMSIGGEQDMEKIYWLLFESNLDLDINAKDKQGKTVLFGWEKQPDITQLGVRRKLLDMYLKKGANVNIQDKYGNTPLHDAVRSRSADVVEWLLNNGAKTDIPNKKGLKAFDLPQANRDIEVRKVIENYEQAQVGQ